MGEVMMQRHDQLSSFVQVAVTGITAYSCSFIDIISVQMTLNIGYSTCNGQHGQFLMMKEEIPFLCTTSSQI